MSRPKLIGQLILEEEALAAAAVAEPDEGEFADTFSQSLNAGLELDHEFPLAEHYAPPEDLELEAVMQEVVAIESRLCDLDYLRVDIERTQGMTQRFALEAQKLLPEVFTDPVGFYTQEPSVTRYRVSLEELSKGVWALIVAAAVTAVAMIYKIYRWATGASKGNKEPEAEQAKKAMEQDAQRIENAPKALDKTAHVIQQADGLLSNANIFLKDQAGREYRCTSMQELIDRLFTDSERYDRAKQVLRLRDPVLRDIVNHGRYTKHMQTMGNRLGLYRQVLDAELLLLDRVVKTDLNSRDASSKLRAMASLKVIKEPLRVRLDSQDLTMTEAAHQLAQLRMETQNQELNDQPINFDHIYSALANAFKHQGAERMLREMAEMMVSMQRLEQHLKKLQEVARDLSTDGAPGALTQDVGVEIRSVIFKVSKDIAGFGQLLHEVRYFANNVAHLSNITIGFAKEVMRKLAVEMRRNKQEVPEGWQDLIKEISAEMKTIEKAYFSF